MEAGLGKKHLAVFSSGQGSNAAAVYEAFKTHEQVQLSLVVSDNPQAGVLRLAQTWGIPTYMCTAADLQQPDRLIAELAAYKVHFIALAGFLRLLPRQVVQAYPKRIFNIHPALLPKYGGKGMYGLHVHKAVLDNEDSHSGITIHEVDEAYDQGPILHQAKFRIPYEQQPTPEWLATQIKQLEHSHYPRIIEEQIINSLPNAPMSATIRPI